MEIAKNIFLVDKSAGITSHTAVQNVKHKLGAKKAGHAGTLDPMATGLLIVGINEGTKALSQYVGLDKTYEAEVLLGTKTDTGDSEGVVTEEEHIDFIAEEEAKKVVESLVGVHRLPVPAYAATKVGGKKLYELARAGKPLQEVVRDMEITEVAFNGFLKKENKYYVQLTVSVSSGTYIRSIAEHIGKMLGYPATLAALRRTKIGDFCVENAITT